MTRSLLPDVDGQRVLEAGCGPGVSAARLADRGADVLGVGMSERMLAEDRERVGGVSHPFPPTVYCRRPLGHPLGSIVGTGFALTGFEEPLLDEVFIEENPEAYGDLRCRPPAVVCLRAELREGRT